MRAVTHIHRQLPAFLAAILFLAALLLFPDRALCRISADAELGYINYDLKNNADQHLSANSFYQRYSILYATKGSILNERFARYDVSLGYEWTALKSSFKSGASENIDEGRGKITYSGDIFVDPKEVPFKLHLYSHDTGGSAFFMGNRFNATTLNNQQIRNDIYTLSPNMNFPMGITAGQHINSGATLVMGVKNGMTNGYNEILRHFPMLMLDYSDRINIDNNYNGFREDNRLSRLAFVSLNKKDNWFHYRYITYKDNVDPGNSYSERQIQIGTVDHLLQRRWIDFSNWLQVSADGQLIKHNAAAAVDSYEEMNLNLFGAARRSSWEARLFSSWNRLKEKDNLITYKTSIPLYASGVISSSTNWDAYAAYKDNVTTKGEQFTTLNSSYHLETFKKSLFTLNQGLSVEHSNQANGQNTLMLSGMVGTNSTNRLSRNVTLSGQYSVNHYVYSAPNNSNTSFTAQNVSARAAYAVSNTLNVTFNQSNAFTTGQSRDISSGIDGVTVNTPQYINPRTGATDVKTSYRSVSKLDATWNPKPRFHVTFSISEDIFKTQDDNKSDVMNIQNQIRYSTAALTLSSINSYTSTRSRDVSYMSNSLSSENTANYIFSRNLDARIAIAYYRPFDSSGASSDILDLSQYLNYTNYKSNGVVRKLFEINQSFESRGNLNTLDNSNTIGNSNNLAGQRTNNFRLGIRYYPLRQLQLSSAATYIFYNRIDNYFLSYYASIAANFSLLSASVDYSYGKSKTDGRIEKIFSANVKKRF